MDYIMVTFQNVNKTVDLKVPSFVKIADLMEMLGEALQINVSSANRIQAEPLGRILDNNKSLLQEDVTQGSLLTLI